MNWRHDMSKNKWIDDIENAHPDEQEEMTQQPSGYAIVWLFIIAAIWTVIALIVYFVFIK
jgi:hypothetical protein